MGEVLEESSIEWQQLRPDVAEGIIGKTLLSGNVKVVLARVAPGGKFLPHRDAYSHLFYVLAGAGRVHIDGKEFPLRPGSVVRIAAGETHAYENTDSDDLVIFSLNLPAD
jgi:quercetin dioxygenase-like cupin family protein